MNGADLFRARGFVDLPGTEEVDRETDQLGAAQGTGLVDQCPEPVGGLEDVQGGFDMSWLSCRVRDILRIVVEAHDIADTARLEIGLRARVIGVGVRVFQQRRDLSQRCLVIDEAVFWSARPG
ncbi:hypothetical protein [Ktedonobacter sp. SOSP1-52]|uniref:hypothetical protein n=1 Tax=Ktedonobacter sp. SOSP1-52 TaxID=2778366 RepID=UPI0019169178|nr:hypothetical protein [Ktedonobacter sp. SOSP1-52]